jgi:hypothetical protein
MRSAIWFDPDAVYDDGTLLFSLGLTETVLARARRAGTLRHTRQGRQTLYRGAWVLAWLESSATSHEAERQEVSHEG